MKIFLRRFHELFRFCVGNGFHMLVIIAAFCSWSKQPLVAQETVHEANKGIKRPNVLFIVTDDMNTSLRCYGHPLVKSPNIDRLASLGVRFDRAYCQAPVCNPTRASMFSGLLPENVGVLNNGGQWPEKLENSQYMPDLFRSQGYYTGTIGKTFDHKRVPLQPYWDLMVHEWGKYPDEAQFAEQGAYGKKESHYWAKLNVPDEKTGDGDVARWAAVVLAKKADWHQPFFLAVGFRRPHAPYAVPSNYFANYSLNEIALPYVPLGHQETILRAARGNSRSVSQESTRALLAYFASISFVDAQVGLLLDSLDRHHLWDNTIIVFISDHGFLSGHHGMWKKGNLFEQTARVPMIVVAPGKGRGEVCKRTVEILDLYPTLTDLCGLNTPSGFDGVSLVPLLENPKQSWQRGAITVSDSIVENGKRIPFGRSIRTERFRYTEWHEGRDGVELYDYKNDPDEFVNLAENTDYAETITRLRDLLHQRLVKKP